jgi:tetratricopeptide (TPR) repeat protein
MTLVDRARVVALVTVAGLVGQLAPARAQSAEAEVLFRDGRNLIKGGKLAAGCDKLDASARLESSVGTLLNLGDCREKLGRLASAWAAFRKAEALAKHSGADDKRLAEASRRAGQLEPRLSNLVIEVSARIEGLVVRREGEVVDPALWGTALPVDPGSYTIVAEAPGHLPWRTVVPIRGDASRQVVVIPDLERAPEPRPTIAPEQTQATIRRGGTWSGVRALSAVLGVAGAGALGTGIYFGFHAKDLQDRADRRCPLAVCADPDGLRWNHDAQTSATRANILYIAGGAVLATSVVLWLVGAPGETVVMPTAGDHQLGASLTGRF